MKRGTLLVISTGSAALSVAAFTDGTLAAHSHEIIGRGHAEALIGTVAQVLEQAGLARADAVLVDIGPGSFTGVRIGVAAARALGLAWGAEVTGCTAASLVAARAFADRPDADAVTVLLDAGRGQQYRQHIARDFTAGPLTVATAAAHPGPDEIAADPDAGAALLLPEVGRSLPPAPLYVRPVDAVLPL